MNAMVRNRYLQQYTQTNLQTGVENATPHRLVQMLYEGALDVLAQAKGAIQRRDLELKAKKTNHLITIINGLRSGLDHDLNGEIVENLDSLYEFLARRVFAASRDNSVEILDEVADILRTLKTAWDEMPEDVRKLPKEALEKKFAS
ncbi:MAG: flagellar export chaperone FliS [Thiotrichales bacterium]|jgi:flagellar protein FliS|nr:flagellar export chaperone FliS [Thiotrichales bacterium]